MNAESLNTTGKESTDDAGNYECCYNHKCANCVPSHCVSL